jgi:hypothetical protein
MPRYPIDDEDDEHTVPYDADEYADDPDDGDWVAGDEDELLGDDYDDGLDDEIVMVSCPACGADVIADVGKCPCCGEYLEPVVEGWQGRPWWWIALGLLGVIAVIMGSF